PPRTRRSARPTWLSRASPCTPTTESRRDRSNHEETNVMSDAVKMPALGESVTEGTVTRWLKSVGDEVALDEPLLEVSTDKVDTEIPSPFAGILEKILVEEDETVEVGAPLAVIGSGEGSSDGDAEPEAAEPAAEPEQAPAESAPQSGGGYETPAPADEVAPAAQEPPAQESAPAEQASGGDGEEIKLPALGESVTEGTVTRWLKQVGETVEVDEPLLEVSTDKVDTEIPSPVAGTVLEIRVQEDEDAEVGSVLAIVGSADAAAPKAEEPAAPAPAAEEAPKQEAPKAEEPKHEAPKTEAPAAPAAAPAPQAAAPAPKASEAVSGAESSGYVTPLVRKMAAEAGVDLSTVAGSG